MSKQRGEGPSPTFSIAPQVLPEGPFATVPAFGHPSFEESLANQSTAQGQVRHSERGQRQCPYQEDKLCLLNGLRSQGLFTQPYP